MNNLEIFKKFAKKNNSQTIAITSNAIIYTRVSTKEQAETNLSLDTQKRHCIEFAKKKQLIVHEFFGGTYESAKTDERKEFQRMMNYLKKQKQKISHIIVYSIDRFSRSGSNAIFISEQLKKQGIHILSVTQEMETNTPSGKFQQNMYFMFSQLDNDMRRDKTVAGMREMLRQGYWATKAPIGYSHVFGVSRDKRIVIDDKGKLIQKAFNWKVDENISNVEIVNRLNKLDFKINKQRLTDIFNNPFYCGIIVTTMLEGEIIKGKHPKIVSEELFLKVSDLLSKNNHGYRQQKDRAQFPLKQFVKCDLCGTSFTAYRLDKKNAEYYKCNKIGCGCNKNSEKMHQLFSNLLAKYSADEKALIPMQNMMSFVFEKLNESNIGNKDSFMRALKICKEKIETIEEKYVLGEIDRPLYEKFVNKYNKEKAELEQKTTESSFELSNYKEYVNYVLQLSSKLPTSWLSANYETKVQIQNLVFPEGVRFNKEKNDYRTFRVNSFFSAIPTLSIVLGQKRSGLSNEKLEKSALVAGTGLEPMTFGL